MYVYTKRLKIVDFIVETMSLYNMYDHLIINLCVKIQSTC